MKLWLENIKLDLKVNWKLSRNETNTKENFIVHLETTEGKFLSEIAPNIRYCETPEKIQKQFDAWLGDSDVTKIKDIKALTEALSTDLFHSLRFGLESVFLSWFAKKNQISLEEFLGLPKIIPVPTSFSMPIMPVGEIQDYLAPLARFKSLKIKVNSEGALETLREVQKFTKVPLRVDANEGWNDFDDFMNFQNSLRGMNIELIEQPFPASMISEYKELKKKTGYPLLADESIENVGDFSELKEQFHAVNIKLMKTGSLLGARDLILEAKKHQMKVMMGCMIETTIGIKFGMLFSGMVEFVDLDGFLLIKNEPFQLVTEEEGILSLV